MTEPLTAVFLSYASQDSGAAHRLAAALRAGGVDVWLDTTELRGGDDWDKKIKQQIRECALFVPVISATTQARDEGYFRLEWKLGVERTRLMAGRATFLLPVVIDETTDRDAEVPEEFRNVQWTRLLNGETPPEFVVRISGLLEAKGARLVAKRPIVTPAMMYAPLPAPIVLAASVAKRAPEGRMVIVATATIAVLVIVYGGWQQFKSRQPTPVSSEMVASTSTPTTTSIATAQSVAVMPFVNESSDKEQEYFADGLTDTMINLLSKVQDLRVPARSSSFFFKGKTEDLSAIAAKLHVTHVLEGTVRKAGNRLRVSAELIRADTGFHAWSETYDRNEKDIFKVQDEISAAVVAALKLRLVAASATALVHGTTNPEAYNQYLIGMHASQEIPSPDTYRHAAQALRKSTTLDPAYADAKALLVLVEAYLADFTGDAAGLKRATGAAERLPLEHPDHGPSYRVRADVRSTWLWDWRGAQADYEKALALDPADSAAYYDESLQLDILGQFREAVVPAQKALAFDGLNLAYAQRLATSQIALRDYAAAEETVNRMAEIDPRSEQLAQMRAIVRLLQGRYAESLTECSNLHDERIRLVCSADAQHALGRRSEADRSLADLLKTGTGGNLTYLGSVYAWFGEADPAFAWFDKAVVARESLVSEIRYDRTLDKLHNDPRWKALLKKMNLPI